MIDSAARENNRTSSIVNTSEYSKCTNVEVFRDIIIGLSDGLTVPFGLAAGLASFDHSRLVVTAGIAELVAGSISMGLGGYQAGLSEIEHYESEFLRQTKEIQSISEKGNGQQIEDIFAPYGIKSEVVQPITTHLTRNRALYVDFVMKFGLNLDRPNANRAWISAVSIGFSYFVGGLIPLFPYLVIPAARTALVWSAAITILALFVFGFVKAKILGQSRPVFSAFQMALIGTAAAVASYAIALMIPIETARSPDFD